MAKRQLSPQKLQAGALALLEELAELFDDLEVPTERESKKIAQAVRYARYLIDPTTSVLRVCPEVAAKRMFDMDAAQAAVDYSRAVTEILLRLESLAKKLNYWRNKRLAAAGMETFVTFAYMKRWVATPAGAGMREHFKTMQEGMRRANARAKKVRKKKDVEE